MPALSPEAAEQQALLDFFRDRPAGFFVEVGANDPRGGSQTWPFEQRGWTGLLVEPMQKFYDRLVAARPRSRVVRAACGRPEARGTATLHVAEHYGFSTLARHVDDTDVRYVATETVPLVALDDLLAELAPPRVDFVSIDVEGTELDVLRGFDLARWRPELVLVEDKLHGLDKHRHLLARGYRLLRRTCLNGWYVPRAHPARAPLAERIKLIRKYYLGLPFRRLQRARRARRAAKAS